MTFSKTVNTFLVQQSHFQGNHYNTLTEKYETWKAGRQGGHWTVVCGFVVSLLVTSKPFQWVTLWAIDVIKGPAVRHLRSLHLALPFHAWLCACLFVQCFWSNWQKVSHLFGMNFFKENPSMSCHLFSLCQKSHRDLSKAKQISLLKLRQACQ